MLHRHKVFKRVYFLLHSVKADGLYTFVYMLRSFPLSQLCPGWASAKSITHFDNSAINTAAALLLKEVTISNIICSRVLCSTCSVLILVWVNYSVHIYYTKPCCNFCIVKTINCAQLGSIANWHAWSIVLSQSISHCTTWQTNSQYFFNSKCLPLALSPWQNMRDLANPTIYLS